MKICRLEYCDREAKRGSLCPGHRTQRERGRPLTPIASRSLDHRLWSKVQKTDTCWLWTASLMSSGYGQINIDRRPHPAHRIAYELANGPIPEGLFLDHLCHVRRCVNPSHLRIVTNKENGEHRSGPPSNNKSGVLGVSWDSKAKKWYAKVGHHGRHYFVGLFDRIDEAEAAVIAKRLELFTHNNKDRIAA